MKLVKLKLINLDSGISKILCQFTGGQGSINVPSWSPDSKKFAFISYQISKKNRNLNANKEKDLSIDFINND